MVDQEEYAYVMAQTPRRRRTSRAIVAHNLRTLMEQAAARGDMDRAKAVRLEQLCGVSDSAINRALNQKTGISIDHLEKIADAFGLQAYNLLIDAQEAAHPAALPTATAVRELSERFAAVEKLLRDTGGIDAVEVGTDFPDADAVRHSGLPKIGTRSHPKAKR